MERACSAGHVLSVPSPVVTGWLSGNKTGLLTSVLRASECYMNLLFSTQVALQSYPESLNLANRQCWLWSIITYARPTFRVVEKNKNREISEITNTWILSISFQGKQQCLS